MVIDLMAQPPSSGAQSSIIFAILGSIITAAATVGGLFVKNFLDRSAEKRSHQRSIELRALDDALTIRKLSLEVSARRSEFQNAELRSLAAEFLARTMAHYSHIRSTRALRRRASLDEAGYVRELRRFDPSEGQVALEKLRLFAPDQVIGHAERLWLHLRLKDFPMGRDSSAASWRSWKHDFWVLKNALATEVRSHSSPGPTDPEEQAQ